MPTYEYACTACEHKFERFESITSKPNTACPACKKKKAERQISGGGGFIFKGTGFYITDYKKSGGGGDSGAAASKDAKPAEGGHSCTNACAHGAKSSTDSSGSTSTEAKPAKTESKSEKPKVA